MVDVFSHGRDVIAEPFSHGGRCVLPWCKCKGWSHSLQGVDVFSHGKDVRARAILRKVQMCSPTVKM